MFVFCGLITEAYYVHCFRRSWLAWLCPWGTWSPAGSWTCTTWWSYRVTVPAWPSYSSRTSSTKVTSLIGSTFQKFNFEWLYWKTWCILHFTSQWGWLHRDTSQTTHPSRWAQGWRRTPLTARAASSESLMLTCLRVDWTSYSWRSSRTSGWQRRRRAGGPWSQMERKKLVECLA